MPRGKPAGVRCVQLTADDRCRLFGRSDRPAVCVGLRPSVEMCGGSFEEAMAYLTLLEERSAPQGKHLQRTAPQGKRSGGKPMARRRITTRKWTVVILVLLIVVAGAGTHAHGEPSEPPGGGRGTGFGLEASAGMQGALSFYQVGVLFPKIKGSLFVNLSARIASSLTWATFIDYRTGESVSFHPMVAAGVLSFGGMSPFLYDVVRMYGGTDLLLGYSFMPYDSAIYGVPNLIGNNLTFAVLGYFGIEFFTGPRLSMIAEAGGGYKSMFGDEANPYVIASSWLGSGFAFRMGLRFYPWRPRG